MEPGLTTEQPEDQPLTSVPSPGASAGASERHLVVVPREVGPVVPLKTGASGPRDDLDELVDDVFGPSTDERPGPFDLLLVIAGAIVLAWAVLTGAATWLVVVAVVAIVLGLALPARSLVRRYRGAAVSRRMRSAGRRGYVLDVTAGSTAELLGAHGELDAAAALPGSVYGERALDAAHEALVEVASLLEGAPPTVPAQDEYVAKRTRAIATLARQLRDAHTTWLAGRAETAAEEAERRERWVTAVTQARDELQAEDRQGSLARLARLTTRLDREAGDDAG
jgi:hypothetical protein